MSKKSIIIFSISFLLILSLILWIGPYKLYKTVIKANWNLLVLAMFTHIFAIIIRSVRWGILTRENDLKKNFIVKTIGLFAGNITPSRAGGEPITALAGKKINKISFSLGMSAGLVERFFDLGVVGIILIIVGFSMPKLRFIAIIGGLLSILITVLIYVFAWNAKIGTMLYVKFHNILKFLPLDEEILDNLYVKAINTIEKIVTETRKISVFRLFLVSLLSILSWLTECFRLYLVILAFNKYIAFPLVVVLFLIVNVVGIVSALPGGMGSIEVSSTGLLVLFKIPSSIAGSIAFMDRVVSFWLVTILGLAFSIYYAPDILDETKKYIETLKTE